MGRAIATTLILLAWWIACRAGQGAAIGSQLSSRPDSQPTRQTSLPSERQDLLGTGVLWQAMPSSVRAVEAVTFDRTGRAWFELEGNASLDETKSRVQQSALVKAPYVVGAKILLHDKKGRIWLQQGSTSLLLLGYDPGSGTWLERKPIAQGHFTGSAFESSQGILYFSDNLGVHVFDGREWTYQPLFELNLKHDLWHGDIQAFNPPKFIQDAQGRVFVWSEWGTWGWTGTVGVFVHDGHTWQHRFFEDYRIQLDANGKALPAGVREKADRNRLIYVVPLGGQRVLAQLTQGRSGILVTGDPDQPITKKALEDISLLSDDSYQVRQAAHERLAKLGSQIGPVIIEAIQGQKDVETAARLERLVEAFAPGMSTGFLGLTLYEFRTLGRDPEGKTWLWAKCDEVVNESIPLADRKDRAKGRILIITQQGTVEAVIPFQRAPNFAVFGTGRTWLACYEDGVYCLQGKKLSKISDDKMGIISWVWGEDKEGRLFLSNGYQAWAYHPDKPDLRKELKWSKYLEPSTTEMLQADSRGDLWVYWATCGVGLERSEKGRWQDTAPPAELVKHSGSYLLQPLRDGAMIFQVAPSDRLGLYDGREWTTYDSVRELVEKRYEDLARLIDNGLQGHDFYVKLRLDGKGRIWVVNWEQAAVYDGKAWVDLIQPMGGEQKKVTRIEALWPLPGKDAMLAYKGQWQQVWIEDGKIRCEPRKDIEPFTTDMVTRSSLWMDKQGRLFIPQRTGYCVLVDKTGAQSLKHAGWARFADSSNRIYLVDPWQRILTVMDGQGRSTSMPVEGLSAMSFFGEDAQGNIWVTTHRGLLQLTVSQKQQSLTLRPVVVYEKNAPVGECNGMWIDSHQNLWWVGRDSNPNHPSLYKIELPSKAGTQPASVPAEAGSGPIPR